MRQKKTGHALDLATEKGSSIVVNVTPSKGAGVQPEQGGV